MANKIFQRVGLRRDKNLSDLSNSTTALNNLLDTLVDTATNTFISEDLNAIRNIAAYGLDNAGYRQVVGSSAKTTSSNGIERPFLPQITYQNQLDKFRVFSGEPRYLGGNGLSASYYNKEQVFDTTTDVFSGASFKTDNFWEQGIFEYSGKITPESVDTNGGVKWEGYFIPTDTGSHTFRIDSTACFTLDFQTEGYTSGIGTYTEVSRIGLTTTFAGSGTLDTNSITLTTASNTKYVGIGQSVSRVGIVTGSTVDSLNRTTGVITLTPPTGTTYAVFSTFSGDINFTKSIGQNTQISYSTYVLEANEKYRIRARYFIPQSVDAISAQRNITFYLIRPRGDNYLRYTNLYDLNYDFSEGAKGDFTLFENNSILSGGGTIGGSSSSNDYVKVKSTKKVDILYQPKTSVSAITKASTTATTVNGSKLITISNTSGIEIGNYVFGSGITDGTKVNSIIVNNSIFLDTPATASASVTLTFIDHRGFVKRAVGYGGTSAFVLSSGNTTDLKSNMIMIGSNVNAYTGITTVGSASTFTISPSQTIGAGTTVYFYQSRGLINNALSGFCLPINTKCLIVTSATSIGSTTIPVSDSSNVGVGWSVQGSQFATGTTIFSIPNATSIIISAATTKNLIVGANFTVTNAGDDRQLCCPPTDTSPPFNPTEEGLDTVSGAPSLRIESGDIKFDALTATISSGNITAYSTEVSKNRISISTPSGTFKILCA